MGLQMAVIGDADTEVARDLDEFGAGLRNQSDNILAAFDDSLRAVIYSNQWHAGEREECYRCVMYGNALAFGCLIKS
jgi:hypothetical protein